jgi:hypothetical protein
VTIDADVHTVAKHFGLDPALIQAVVRAEGDILKAVRCSFPNTPNRTVALDITCRSAVHAMCDFITTDASQDETEPLDKRFVEFWGARWAPRGVANDPTDLNKNWPVNVLKLWRSA